jgi:hypothetical protein
MDITAAPTLNPAIFDVARQMKAFLEDEGFKVEIDSDGDLVFRAAGLNYLLCFDQRDLQYARLMLPGVWEIEDGSGRARALAAADFVNRRCKLVKAHSVRNDLYLCVQLLTEPISCWKNVLLRCVRALGEARYMLVQAIQFPQVVAIELDELDRMAQEPDGLDGEPAPAIPVRH